MPRRARAFTLVELLLVVFILAAVAATAASLGTQVDEQFRYDDTRARREQIRLAILGDPSRTANGQPVVSGFVADVGRLPLNLRELIIGPADASLAWQSFAAGQQLAGASGAAQAAGWRGPYLRADLERDPTTHQELATYRDGWRVASGQADPNLGWGFLLVGAPPALELFSKGADGLEDAAPPAPGAAFSYAWDQPLDAGARRLVGLDDHLVDLAGWSLTVRNGVGATIDLAQVELRVLVPAVPDLTAAGPVDWSQARLSGPLVGAGTLADGQSAGAGPLAFAPDARVAWGRRCLVPVKASDHLTPVGDVVAVTLLPRAALPELTVTITTDPSP